MINQISNVKAVKLIERVQRFRKRDNPLPDKNNISAFYNNFKKAQIMRNKYEMRNTAIEVFLIIADTWVVQGKGVTAFGINERLSTKGNQLANIRNIVNRFIELDLFEVIGLSSRGANVYALTELGETECKNLLG